ncbi:MAG: hypothetical protein V3T02_05135, partial [Alphaproteobacteria bacterium]
TIVPVRSYLYVGGYLYFAWVIPAAIITGLFGLAYTSFLLHLESRFRRLFVASAVLYVGGAIGLELVGGKVVSGGGESSMAYALIATGEETLEISGVILFIYALATMISEKTIIWRRLFQPYRD